MTTPLDIINHAVNDDPVQMQDSLNNLMLSKIKDVIDQKRIEVAQNFFGADQSDEVDDNDDDYNEDSDDLEETEIETDEDQEGE